MPCTTRRVFLSTKTDISQEGRNAGINRKVVSCFPVFLRDCFCALISVFVCESRACFRRDRETAPSSKPASPSFQYQIRHRVFLASRRHHQNPPPQTRRWFHRATVATLGENRPRSWSGQDRTRPRRHPFACL